MKNIQKYKTVQEHSQGTKTHGQSLMYHGNTWPGPSESKEHRGYLLDHRNKDQPPGGAGTKLVTTGLQTLETHCVARGQLWSEGQAPGGLSTHGQTLKVACV